MDSDRILSEIERVANLVGESPSATQFNEHADISHMAAVSEFGSWNHAKEEAGLDTYKRRTDKSKHGLWKDLVENTSCQVCDEDFWGALEFHHLPEYEKGGDVWEMKNARYDEVSYEDYKKEIQKCAIICANCHSKIHNRDHKLESTELEPLKL